ncbi:Uncharacterized protein K02A2.6 [Eumeta japonica]|uniref:Uncharacterized protein K02A2.6 n=1 Tax=Eumeta variegata TaxID=151549 RepID=A0A4C1VL72_EUMVA|nr:Uncharacterized protein K02A2.6 [Eumeta japonica]
MSHYLQNLKHLAATCNFGTNLEENLRDQFVSGLASGDMRSRIFAEPNLEYKRALELALALEAAERHAGVSIRAVLRWRNNRRDAAIPGRRRGPARPAGGAGDNIRRISPMRASVLRRAAAARAISVDSSAYGLGAVLAHRYRGGSERLVCYASRTLNDTEKSYSQLDKEALAIFYAASRLQRYAARLAAYDYRVEWVRTVDKSVAVAFSRLPLSSDACAKRVHSDITRAEAASHLHYVENELPISHRDIADATKCDPALRKIYRYITFGWPQSTEFESENLIFIGNKIYMSKKRDVPPYAPLTPWPFPARPWQRLHADFVEYRGKHYLVVVDANTKWIELVTDSGPPFGSSEIKNYMMRNAIAHCLSSPYRPQGNSAAEDAVKTIKKCIKKAIAEGEDPEQALSRMLFHYRKCEHATITGVSPAMAMFEQIAPEYRVTCICRTE